VNCPKCQTAETRILSTIGSGGVVSRTRRCEVPACESTWITLESVVPGSVVGKYLPVHTGTPPVPTGKYSPPDPPLLSLSGSGSDPDRTASEISGDRGSNGRLPPPPADFVKFWAAYPRKVGKADALRAWKRHRPPIEQVLAALKWQVASDSWTENGGEFIPHPASYLNAGRWEDEPEQPRAKGAQKAEWV